MFHTSEKSVIPDSIAKILSGDSKVEKGTKSNSTEGSKIENHTVDTETESSFDVGDQLRNIAKKVRGEDEENVEVPEKDFSEYMNPPEELQESRIIDFEIVLDSDQKFSKDFQLNVIDRLSDKTGKFSQLLTRMTDNWKVSTVPAEIVKFDKFIDSYSSFEKFKIEGMSFIGKKEPDKSIVDNIIDDISNTLVNGESFRMDLLYDLKSGDEVVKNLRLSRVELSVILSVFKDYGAHVRKEGKDSLYLDVKGFDYE